MNKSHLSSLGNKSATNRNSHNFLGKLYYFVFLVVISSIKQKSINYETFIITFSHRPHLLGDGFL